MKDSIVILDDFLDNPDEVRSSALQSGFGTWRPNKGEVGSSIYDGMSFWGKHAACLRSLTAAMGRPVFPNNMFFRITTPETEKAYIHSDRQWGAWTAVLYLSSHTENYGTGFYRHRETGLLEMPTFEEMKKVGIFDKLSKDMVEGGDEAWEALDYVRGVYNRCVVFHAPLFHSRMPKHGIGSTPGDARMTWVCHFLTQ